jgi:hypothetical protein
VRHQADQSCGREGGGRGREVAGMEKERGEKE